MFLELHYRSEPGRAFLVNVKAIAGVEINGTPEKGCVLTLMINDKDGDQRFEEVRETFEEVTRLLCNRNLL